MRYTRQILLPDFGEEGQKRLRRSTVLVVGLGGLGSPVATYLAAAGVGRLILMDDDVVSESNLHRQVLYDTTQIGRKKALCATKRLRALNPDVEIVPLCQRFSLDAPNDFRDFKDLRDLKAPNLPNLILDCTDNFQTRYAISDYCQQAGIPMVHAAISGYTGHLAVLCHPEGHATYRTLFQAPLDFPERKETAVLPTTPAVLGSMQANQALLLLANIGEPLIDKLFTIDLRTMQSVILEL